jgi:queuine tRNA-ribosyltransferase
MPVGTRGTVRGVAPSELASSGASIILCNTYHLWIRPGHENIARRGGIHTFTAWDRPILTDSGGYQVFSLREHAKVTEEGVRFRSPEDGEYRMLSPEIAIAVQEAMGVDVAMAFDECLEWPATRERARESAARTTRWLLRCRDARKSPEQTALFAIAQGGTYPDLRAEHAQEVASLDLDGYAIGGLSVGEDRDTLLEMARVSAAELPSDRVRYLMGVGHPVDIADAVLLGVDLFDCVLPTRAGRHGHAYTSVGRRNLNNARYVEDDGPLDPACDCPTCATFSLAYLRHLTRCDEMLGKRSLTIHNLWYYQRLVRRLREAVVAKDPGQLTAIRAEAAAATAVVAG